MNNNIDYINSQNIKDNYTQLKLLEFLDSYANQWWLNSDNIILALIGKIEELEIRLHIGHL